MNRLVFIVGATLWLGACASTGVTTGGAPSDGGTSNLPDQLVALAAPGQDLRSVKLMPEDGCYWYRHVGPVETTMLPLLSVNKRHICTASSAAAAPAPAA